MFLPDFPVEDYPKLEEMKITGYRIRLNVYITGIIDNSVINNEDYTTYYYPANLYKSDLYKRLDDVESL